MDKNGKVMSYYGEQRLALRANLHSHTTSSDGKIAPQELIRLYAERGYDVLALTDHRQIHDVSPYDPCGMVLIPGGEINPVNPGQMRWHILVLNCPLDFKYATPVNPEVLAQEVIDAANASGGLAAVAHPYWCNFSSETVKRVNDYFAIEVYNSQCRDVDRAYSLQTWDELLLDGCKVNAIAVDDVHSAPALFRGWTMICAKERTVESIMDALRKGEFYASQGPEFRKFEIVGDTLTVEFSDVTDCCFMARTGRCCIAKSEPQGPGSESPVINSATLDLSNMRTGINFVRCHICDAQGHHAWSNPIYL